MRYRFIIVTFLLILVAPGLVAFTPLRPQNHALIALDVEAGYGSYFRRGQWTPVRVTISNSGDDLAGQVRVRTGAAHGLSDTTYRTPIDLSRGARKQIFLYVSLSGSAQNIQVEIVDERQRIVALQSTNVRVVSQGDILYAVVTESPYGAVDLTALVPGTGSAYQTNWQIEDIPPQISALSGLDVLMFHDVDSGVLTADQVAAISGWVLTGGHLIIAGGDTWQQTTAGFQTLLPTALQGTVLVDSLGPLADYLRLSGETLNQATTVTRNTPVPKARTLVTVDGVPLVVRGTYGEGVIDFLAIDPNAEPFRSWDGKGQFWYTLMATTGQQPVWTRGFTSWSTAREATLTTSSAALPTFFQLCGFLALYVVLLGPVNYLVLKVLNRHELAWFSIPFLIVAFSVFAYRVGFNLRGNTATINRLTVVREWPDSDQAVVNSLIGVQSPRRSTYSIAVDRGYMLRTLPDLGTGLDVPATITEGTRFVAEGVPIDAGTVASFSADGSTEVPLMQALATWDLSENQAPRVFGSFTNTTGVTLEDAVVLVKGDKRTLGSLSPGETRAFNISLGPQDPGPLTLGNPLNQYGLYYSGTWGTYSFSPGWCFSYQGIPLTIADVMNNEDFPCTIGGIDPRKQEIRRRYRVLGSLIVDTDVSGGRGANVYVFAWAESAPVGVELLNKPQAAEDTTLYIFTLPITATVQAARAEVPPGLTTWTVIETDDPATMLNATPNDLRLGTNAQAVFSFMPMPGMRLKTVDELMVKFQFRGLLQLQLWDWKAQEWVPFDLDPNGTTTTITNPERYIGPENAVHVKIISLDPTAYSQIDFVRIGYRGQLAE